MSNSRAITWHAAATPGIWLVALMLVVTFVVLIVAPADVGMGPTQRIVYVHVSMAWLSLLSFVVMAGTGLQYLRVRDLKWDFWSNAAAEIGWLCCSLTLLTGSFWAHEAWGTWWTWDPRLTTSFILWLIYSSCLLARESRADAHHRARIGAVLATIGLLDVPLVTLATRWFRGIHPVSPEMEPSMRVVLAIAVACFTVFFAMLLVHRQQQLQRQHDVE
jgi:heme exporter protein C